MKRAATIAAERIERCIAGTETLSPVEFNACRLAINKFVPDMKALELKHTSDKDTDELRHLLKATWANPPSRLPQYDEINKKRQ